MKRWYRARQITPNTRKMSAPITLLKEKTMPLLPHGSHPKVTRTPAVSATQNSESGRNTFQPSRMSWS